MSDPVCEHGSLRRKCELCERDERIAELEEAVFWALGCHGVWPERQEGQGKFYWRIELGDRAGLSAERINERALRGENRPLDVSGPNGGENSPLERGEEKG
jgi:hypothetical protein